jgi:hypothetical protein
MVTLVPDINAGSEKGSLTKTGCGLATFAGRRRLTFAGGGVFGVSRDSNTSDGGVLAGGRTSEVGLMCPDRLESTVPNVKIRAAKSTAAASNQRFPANECEGRYC